MGAPSPWPETSSEVNFTYRLSRCWLDDITVVQVWRSFQRMTRVSTWLRVAAAGGRAG